MFSPKTLTRLIPLSRHFCTSTQSTNPKLERIADELLNLTKLERNDYAVLLRYKMGFNKYGPSVTAMGSSLSSSGASSAGAGEAKAAEKVVFDVKLEKYDSAAKIKIIKEVRAFTDLGLKEAKDLVEKVPVVVKKGITKDDADAIVAKLKELGATVGSSCSQIRRASSGFDPHMSTKQVYLFTCSNSFTASQQGAGKVGKRKINFMSTQNDRRDPYANVGDAALSFTSEEDAKAFCRKAWLELYFKNIMRWHILLGPSGTDKLLSFSVLQEPMHMAIEIGLSTKRKLGFVRGTVARSATDANQAELSIMFIGTASEIWNQLEKKFALSDGSRKYKLNKDTYEFKQSGGSTSEYYIKMKCVWEELDSINVLPVINTGSAEVTLFLTALSKQKEEQRLFQFLNGLDEHYANQRSQILMINPLPSIESTCSMLQQEESQRVLFGSSSVETTALLSKGKFQEKCSICGFKWHPPEKYWEKVGYPNWHPKHKVSNQFKPREGQNKGHGQVRTIAHVESRNVSFTPQQFEQLLRSFQIKNAAADDDAEFAYDFAAVRLNNGILLKDVLVVPSFKYSLLSVPKLTQDNQCVVSFYPDFCMVHDLVTKKVTGLGKLKSGLYHLLNVPTEKVDQVFSSLVKASVHKFSLSAIGGLNSVNKTGNDAYALWHHRLGHVSDSKLKYMNDFPVVLPKSHNAECLSCPMAKFAKLPYDHSDSHSTEVFDLIHIDIWGPYKVATAEKFHKSDSFLALKAFLKFVNTQFNKFVKVVRSDNALEFVKGECGPYLQSQGILHQTSCVDRPQQNGRVERKHRHILDTARALRLHSHLPLKFWGDCVTTTTYLINRIPSSVLKNKSPYEILLGQVPTYSHLRVFGCFAIVSNPSRIPDKFSPRGTPCVFLGYPSNQKGYKFYHLQNHSTFVSRDATFYEHIFPFSTGSVSQFLSPLPTILPCQTTTHAYDDITDPIPNTPQTSSSDIPNNTIPSLVHVSVSSPVSNSENTQTESASSNQPSPPHIPIRRSSRQTNLPTKLKYFVLTHTPRAMGSALSFLGEYANMILMRRGALHLTFVGLPSSGACVPAFLCNKPLRPKTSGDSYKNGGEVNSTRRHSGMDVLTVMRVQSFEAPFAPDPFACLPDKKD
ncbi:cysteine-rich receptor-like protein kinase 8 [Tanacetum coccineum]